MRILVLPSWYPTDDDPIRGCFFREQAQALSRGGHRVSVFAFYADAARGVRVEEKTLSGVREYAIHYRRLRFHLTYFRVLLAMVRLWRSMPRSERPEVIHVHSYGAMKYARALKGLFGVPVVLTEHVSWFQRGLLSEKDKAAVRRDYAGADAILAVSEGLKEQIQPFCGRPVQVVPNLVDEAVFAAGVHRPAGERFGFISVGSLNKNKGMDAVLSAFAGAAEREKGLALTICGGGEERPALEAQAEELGIRDRVTFTGQVSREECVRLLRENQAFVLASRVETFGIAAAEAMACGLPVIMTKTSAWKTLITPECGVAVEVDDTAAITEAMLRIVRGYDEYDPSRIAASCRERFSGERIARQLTDIYREVLR